MASYIDRIDKHHIEPKQAPEVVRELPGAVFVNGHMFAGLFQTSVILRMSEGDLAAARVAINAELFEPIPGRVMREYVVVPNAVVQSPKLLGDWLKRGHAFASIMPPKSAKKATSDV